MERRESNTSFNSTELFRRFGQKFVLAGAILGAGFLMPAAESYAQTRAPELLPTPILPSRPITDPLLFAECELGPQQWEGTATQYYPGDGCQGCREDNLTSMQVPLDWTTRTIAFMRLDLGRRVKITNLGNGLMTDAMVTDRGGFEGYGYIADLAPATKAALEAGDQTSVLIQELVRCR